MSNRSEALNQRMLVEGLIQFGDPSRVGKNEVIIDPDDVLGLFGNTAKRNIEQALLLPHDIALVDDDEKLPTVEVGRRRSPRILWARS